MSYGQVAATSITLSCFTQPFPCGPVRATFAFASVSTTTPLKIYLEGISCRRMGRGRPGTHHGIDARYES